MFCVAAENEFMALFGLKSSLKSNENTLTNRIIRVENM